jgi:Flp pilus assembly protein CpaB
MEFAVRAVRYLLRVGVLMLVGVAVFCGLILLLNAQVLLNRYAELYMMDTESSSVLNRINAAPNDESAFASATSEPVRARKSPVSKPQAPSPAILARREQANAIHVSNAESIAAIAASDRWVDVILTHQPGTSAAFSEVVLENVKVLTIEPATADSDSGERSPVYAVTFDIDADTAQDLLLASHSGRLSLVLHRPGDRRAPVEVNQASIPEPVTSVPEPVATIPEPVARAPEPVAPQPTPAQNDPGFTVVTVNRIGGTPTTHRVPRER